MSQLLYFVEGVPHASQATIGQWGLSYAFPAGVVASPFSGQGPGGSQGVVLGVSTEQIGYYPEEQHWVEMGPVENRPRTWCGFWKDSPPTPEELLVAEPLRGRPVRCRDGRDWIAPIAREFRNGAYHRCLPGRVARVGGQWVTGEVEERYTELWEIATEFFEYMFSTAADGENTVHFKFGDALDAAARILQFNYRLGPDECGLLGLFDDQLEVAGKILRATIDFETFWQWQKKNLDQVVSAGWNTFAGGEASPPTTAQPSPTSGPLKRSRKKAKP